MKNHILQNIDLIEFWIDMLNIYQKTKKKNNLPVVLLMAWCQAR